MHAGKKKSRRHTVSHSLCLAAWQVSHTDKAVLRGNQSYEQLWLVHTESENLEADCFHETPTLSGRKTQILFYSAFFSSSRRHINIIQPAWIPSSPHNYGSPFRLVCQSINPRKRVTATLAGSQICRSYDPEVLLFPSVGEAIDLFQCPHVSAQTTTKLGRGALWPRSPSSFRLHTGGRSQGNASRKDSGAIVVG